MDEYEDARQMASVVLEAAGYQLETADAGRRALAQVRAHPPNVIVMDIATPDLDGIETTRRLKTDQPRRPFP